MEKKFSQNPHDNHLLIQGQQFFKKNANYDKLLPSDNKNKPTLF